MIAHIFKYQLPISDEVIELSLPKSAKICEVNCQDDCIYIWVQIDIHEETKIFKFRIFGTGHKIDDVDNLFFIKTVHMSNTLVWHVFGVKE